MVEELFIPTPIPSMDVEREIEELQCAVDIAKAQRALDDKIVELYRTKAGIKAQEVRDTANDVAEKALEVQNGHVREAASLQFALTKGQVEMHKWRQNTALLKVKLSSALEDVTNNKENVVLLKKQWEAEASARQKLESQAEVLRQRILELQNLVQALDHQKAALRSQLASTLNESQNREEEIVQLKQTLDLSTDQARQELAVAQTTITQLHQQLNTIKERVSLAEQTTAAAQERANLAEQSLNQHKALASDRAQFHTDQEQFMHANALERERSSRADAEARAAAAQARANQLETELKRLNSQLEAKEKRIAGLEELVKRQEGATPARVTNEAMNTVGALVGQLADGEDVSPLMMPPALISQSNKTEKAVVDNKGKQKNKIKNKGKSSIVDDDSDLTELLQQADLDDEEEQAAGGRRRRAKATAGNVKRTTKGQKHSKEAPMEVEDVAMDEEEVVKQRATRKRKQTKQEPEAAAVDDDEQAGAAAEEEDKSEGKRKGGRKGKQPKRPTGAAKYDLVHVWGGSDTPASVTNNNTASGEGEDGAAVPTEKENVKKNTSSAAGNNGNDLVLPKSRLGKDPPLAKNAEGTIAAANRHVPTNPATKAHAQKPLLGVNVNRPGLLGVNAAGGANQAGKRRLLGVSSTAGGGALGGGPLPGSLPAAMLFGQGFQVPRLSKK